MIERWRRQLRQMRAYFHGSLGRRLLLAGAGLIALVLFSGAAAMLASYALGLRMQEIVEDSVPAILQSTQLEQESTRLHSLALQLAKSDSLTEIANSQRLIDQPLARMASAVNRLARGYPQQAPALRRQIAVSHHLAETLANQTQQRQSALSTLRMSRMRLEWLHADLSDELQQLSDEQSRLLQQGVADSARLPAEAAALHTLLQLASLEQECAQALLALSRPREQPLPPHAFDHPGRSADLLLQKVAQLPPQQAGNLRLLLQSLQQLTRLDGELAQAVNRYASSAQQVQQVLAQLENQLQQQDKLAASLGRRGHDQAHTQLQQALAYSLQGRWLVVLATIASVALTLWILLRLVGHRVIARLALLGRNIEAVGNGQLPRHIGGSDEIGQLGLQIEQLAAKLAELERTNALALINHTAAALLICERDGTIRSINQAARRLCPQLDVDASLASLLPAATLAQLQALADDASIDVVLAHGEARDEQYLRLLARAFKQNGNSVRMVTLLDVSAQMHSARWLEQMVQEKTEALDASNLALRGEIDERKRAQNSLVQATKFAVLGQTATSLAHELNQPLAALANYLYLAQLQGAGQHELVGTLQQGGKVLERMGRLVRSYRTLGRNAPPSPQLLPLELGQVLNDIIELLQGRIRQQQVQIQLEDAFALPPVAGEVVRLEQIILNLLGNALDAVASGGHITLSAAQCGGRIELYVADDGPGLSADTVSDIFQPFFTTKPDGLGLGLSICGKLAEDCHAEIRMASRLAGGALFILSMEPYHAV